MSEPYMMPDEIRAIIRATAVALVASMDGNAMPPDQQAKDILSSAARLTMWAKRLEVGYV